MIGLIYSRSDSVSLNIAKSIIGKHEFDRKNKSALVYTGGDVTMYEAEGRLIELDHADKLGFSVIYFLSRHRSVAGVPSFTTHPLGNWGNTAELGGLPKRLSVSAPVEMLSMLRHINVIRANVEKTYESTHHGPLLDTPSLFVETGGSEDAIKDKGLALLLGEAVWESVSDLLDHNIHYEKIAMGIGGRHYPDKFSRIAIEKDYAFSHMMPRHLLHNTDGSSNLDMIASAVLRSNIKTDCAVIEKKGLNTLEKNDVISKLNEIGLDYEMV